MRVIRLASVGVTVPAPLDTARFFSEMLDFAVVEHDTGIDITARGEYSHDAPGRMLTLIKGPELGLAALRFDCAALEPLRVRLHDRAIAFTEVAASREAEAGLGFVDPAGVAIACTTGSAPLGSALPPSDVRPRRIGHINIAVRDAAAEAAFYADVLGLRLSEQIGESFFFLRVGSEHHNIGFRANAERTTVHHVGFEIAGWESFRVICDRIAERGHTVEYGPGRHGPGNNLFVYLVDPSSGLRLELFADMARIDDEAGYRAKRWESVDRVKTVNRWGPQPPESFLR